MNERGDKMICIGVTGWGNHDSLYEQPIAPRDKLQVNASHILIVEVDPAFYDILPRANNERWLKATSREIPVCCQRRAIGLG